jgi:ribosomal protein S2
VEQISKLAAEGLTFGRRTLYLFLNINSINFSANKSCFGAPRMEWITTNKPYVVFASEEFSFFKLQSLQLNIKRALLSIYHVFAKNRYSKILFINNLSCGIDKQKDLINKRLSISLLRARNNRMPFISNRLPGMLSNYASTLGFYKDKKINFDKLTKNRFYMHKNRKGLSRLNKFPSVAIFSSASDRFADAIREASSSGIPTVGIMNSNSDFGTSDFHIPGNDNSYISISYFSGLFNEAISRGYRTNLIGATIKSATARRVRRARMFKYRHVGHYGSTRGSRGIRIGRRVKRLRRIFRCTTVLHYGNFISRTRKVLKTLKYFLVKLKSTSILKKKRSGYKRRFFRRRRIKRRKNFFFRDDNFYYRRYYRRHRLVDEMRRYIRVTIFERQFRREAWSTKIKRSLRRIIYQLRSKGKSPLQKYLYFVLSKRRKIFLKRKDLHRSSDGFIKGKYCGFLRKRCIFRETIFGQFVWMVHNYDPVRSRRRGFPTSWRNKRHHSFKIRARVRNDRRFKDSSKFKIKSIFYSPYYMLLAKKLLYNGPISLRYY